MESSREGAGMRDTSAIAVREVLEAVGLDGDIAQYNEMQGLNVCSSMSLRISWTEKPSGKSFLYRR
jgi:hypothetical protein